MMSDNLRTWVSKGRYKLRTYEVRLRYWVRRHLYFFLIMAIAGLISGAIVSYLNYQFWSMLISLCLTAVGFVFTIYGLVQPLEYIDSIPAVLRAVYDMLEYHVKNKKKEVTYICEYPLFGCVSQADTQLYVDHRTQLNNLGGQPPDDLQKKLKVITCDDKTIEDRLRNYMRYVKLTKDDIRNRRNITDAINDRVAQNRDCLRRLDKSQTVKRFPAGVHPRFEAVFTREQAVIFLEVKTLESGTSVSHPKSSANTISNPAAEPEEIKEVAIVGWNIDDPRVIQWLENIANELCPDPKQAAI